MSDVVIEQYGWAVQHSPADAAAGTIAKAAVTNGIHVCRHITISLSGAANAGAVTFVLRDSTTGAGNILWTVKVCNLANESVALNFRVNIPGVRGQAMTLESTVPAAASRVTVAMDGYTDLSMLA